MWGIDGRECEKRSRDPTRQAPQHFLNFFPLPHGHGSLRPDLLSGDLWRHDALFRLFAEFGRFVFASLLLADISQSFEHVRAVPDFGRWQALPVEFVRLAASP